jgi:hypothetical protein
MRILRIPMLGCLVVIALAGALTGCTNPGSGTVRIRRKA